VKKLDPVNDIPFNERSRTAIGHHKPSVAEQIPGMHVAANVKKHLFDDKIQALKDAVIRRAPIPEIEEIQAQARMIDNSDKAEAAIETAMWESRRESQGMQVGISAG